MNYLFVDRLDSMISFIYCNLVFVRKKFVLDYRVVFFFLNK